MLLTDKLAAAKDNEETNPDGLSEVDETPEELNEVVSTVGFLLQIFNSDTGGTPATLRDGNKEPDDSGDDKENRGEEEAVVVSELGDCRGGSERGAGASDFVKDVLGKVERADNQLNFLKVNIRR
jgi:hypothetical protein